MMSAREMFESLGYKNGEESDERYNYKVIKYYDTNTEFVFSINAREFAVSYCEEPKYITVDEFKAIQQQLKELHWLEENVEIKEAINTEVTNLEYYKDEILENCIENLAVVKGRPKLCYKINCNDCDFKLVQKGCHNKVKDWLKQTHIKPTYKLTKFEKDLLQCYSSGHKFGLFNSLIGMKEKGYFKCIDENEEIDYILANCEVVG